MNAQLRDELIEDREIDDFDADRLGHVEIARELEHLVRTVPTPSNIALFGAWGSGKSGIGRLLATQLSSDRKTRFARFDAYKYAENPLRRNFISVVAAELGEDHPRYGDDLYRGTTRTDFTMPPAKILQLVGVFVAVLLVCSLIASAAVVLAAAIQGLEVLVSLRDFLVAALPVSIVPASVLTAAVALAGKAFVVERRNDQAESDEQFEQLLKRLVKDSGASRLVVFVDEVDRCAPDDVVRTLDAIRTFFGVDRCVFVVAADQQVLETALTVSVQQATPLDNINPYYSAGSAYLDKVFNYQLSVPPLLSQSVTSYAIDLVSGRGGAWSEVDLNHVVSVLVPSHVRSPRRVKTLLNAFATTYRIAQARHHSGRLGTEVAPNAAALARIVCMQVEFPLFARDLVLDARLPEYVLALVEQGESDFDAVWSEFPFVDPQVKQVAIGYATRSRPVDATLAEGDPLEPNSAPLAVVSGQGQQLIDYLLRTRFVLGPTRSFLHLQSTGNVFGVSDSVAESVEQDAQNASTQSLRRTIDAATAEQQVAIFDLLVAQARAAVGIEADNVATSILVTVAHYSEVAQRADAAAAVIASTITRSPHLITPATTTGLWVLLENGSRPEVRALGALLLDSPLFVEEITELGEMFEYIEVAVNANRAKVAEAISAHLLSSSCDAVLELLDELTPEDFVLALRPLLTVLGRDFRLAVRDEDATGSSNTAADPDPVAAFEPEVLVRGLQDLADKHREAGNRAAAELCLEALLTLDASAGRDAVEVRLELVSPIESPRVARAVLQSVSSRNLSRWGAWLATIDSAVLARIAGAQGLLTSLINTFWTYATNAKAPVEVEVVASAARALAKLISLMPPTASPRLRAATVQLGATPETISDLDAYERRLLVADIAVEASLAPRSLRAMAGASNALKLLQADLAAQQPGAPVAQMIYREIATAFGDSSQASPTNAAAYSLAIRRCAWIAEPDRMLLNLTISGSTSGNLKAQTPMPSLSKILELESLLPEPQASSLFQEWLANGPTVDRDLLSLVRTRLGTGASVTHRAVERWQKSLSAPDHLRLLHDQIDAISGEDAEILGLRASGLARANQTVIAKLITARYQSESNNQGRRVALQIWSAAEIDKTEPRKRLIRSVLIPFVTLNVDATEKAIGYVYDLAYPVPVGLKRTLGEAIIEGAKHAGLEARGRRLLLALGYVEKASGFLGLGRTFDLDD